MPSCYVCDTPLIDRHTLAGMAINTCPRCGTWQVLPGKKVNLTLGQILQAGPNTEIRRANLSHTIRRQQRVSGHVGVPLDDLENWQLDAPLPSPARQADELILWVGSNQASQSDPARTTADALAAWLGVSITPQNPNRDLSWLINQPVLQQLVEQPNRSAPQLELRLTWQGWMKHHELLHQEGRNNVAFMAMKFGDADLNSAFSGTFKPALAQAGFDLRILTDGQGAGCIDDQLRVALRTSRLVVADLTHRNAGAYWEAGFAEGLGKPVIYTCRKAEWDNEKTHFDTNHLVTVVWDPANLAKAAAELKAIVRATLPKDAVLTDA